MITPLEIYLRTNFPTAFDDSITGLELMGKVIAKVNEMVTSLNGILSTGVSGAVDTILEGWLADGTLATIISSVLGSSVTELDGRVDDLETAQGVLESGMADLTTAENTQNRKLMDMVQINVKDYGAIGDGVADDTAAFKLAIAALPVGSGEDGTTRFNAGGILLIPAGKYKLTDTLTINKNGCVIRGCGVNRTTLDFSSMTGDKDCISAGSILTANNLMYFKQVYQDFQLVGGADVADGFHLENIHRYEITRVDVLYCNRDGLRLLESYIGEINNCHIAGNQGIGINAALTVSGANYANHALRVNGGEIQGNKSGGVFISGATSPVISATIEGNTGYGVKLDGCLAPEISGCYLEGNGTYDIWLDGTVAYVIAGSIINNSCQVSTKSIYVNKARNVEIFGNFCANIELTSSAIRCHIGQNSVDSVTDGSADSMYFYTEAHHQYFKHTGVFERGIALQDSIGNLPSTDLVLGTLYNYQDKLYLLTDDDPVTWIKFMSGEYAIIKTCTTATRPTSGNENGRLVLDLTINKVIVYIDGAWYTTDGVAA